MPVRYCIIVSGLPASGKSTLARALAAKLSLPLLDKDDFLEQLFATRGIGDNEWRTNLSLASNDLFQQEAEGYSAVILVSHWRPKNYDIRSGTPTQWLNFVFDHIVEIYCQCSLQLAAERFQNRQRHPGHCDNDKTYKQLLTWMEQYQAGLPLKLGTTLTVSTESKLLGEIDALADHVRREVEAELSVEDNHTISPERPLC